MSFSVSDSALELKAVFEAAYNRYQRVHAKAVEDGKKLYSNKGVAFEENWQERILERHMLLRMQRVLREHAVKQRRQAMLQQRIKSASAAQSKSSTIAIEYAPNRRRVRPNTVGTASMARSSASVLAPAPTPVTSRPGTATGPGTQTAIPPAPSPAPPTRSRQKDSSGDSEYIPHTAIKKQESEKQFEKQRLGQEIPYRLKLRDSPESVQSQRQYRVRIDPWTLDPRNPTAYRPRSSKSIPSKCSRYVLLTRPRTVADLPVPTALEEELIAERFPDQSMRLLQSAGASIRATPPHTNYGITYTPFSMYS